MNAPESSLWRGLVSLPPYPLGTHRYLLVNQAAWLATPKVIRDLKRYERTALLGQSVDACVDGATPFLLRLDGQIQANPNTTALRRLCTSGCYAAALHVIDSKLPAQDLAKALTQRGDAIISDGQSVLLRYFDARVLAVLLDELTREQVSDLVSCTETWWFADRGGEWVPVVLSPWPEEDTFCPPMRLDVHQEQSILEATEADAIMDVLTRQNNQPLLDLRFEHRHAAVHALLQQARSWGLDAAPDLAAYCVLGLVRGQNFAQSAPWNSLLPEIKAGRMRFDEALQRVESNGSGTS